VIAAEKQLIDHPGCAIAARRGHPAERERRVLKGHPELRVLPS